MSTSRARGSKNERGVQERPGFILSIQEAARRAGASVATIRAWIESGRLEAFRLEGDGVLD